MNCQRFEYVDNAKGLALLCVVSWHCYFDLFPHTVFTIWVLPIFFIVMGLFYKHNLSLKGLVVKKANGLLIPWLFFSFPAVILACIGVRGFETRYIYSPYYCILENSWFLICIFWSYVIYWVLYSIICRYFKNNIDECVLIACCIISAISWITTNYFTVAGHKLILPFYLSCSLTCIIFVGIGSTFKNIFTDLSLLSMKNVMLSSASLMIVIVSVGLGGGKSFNPMWNQTHQPFILAVICSIACSYFVIQLCRIIPNVFSWIGRNTIPFLCIHYYPTQILLKYYPEESPWLRYLLVLSITFPLTYLVSKYLPVLNGKGSLLKL